MNIKQITTYALLALLPLLGQAQQQVITLSGTLPASRNGQKVRVMYGDFKKIVFDSATVENGQVSFRLRHADSQVVRLTMGDAVPMDNTSIYMAGTEVAFTVKDSLKNAVVTGNPLSEDYNRMNGPVLLMMGQRFRYMGEFGKLSAEERKGATGIALNEKIKALAKAEKETTYRAIDENGNSYIALFLLKALAGGTVSYDEMMPHFQHLSAALKVTPEGKALEEKIMLVKGLRSGLEANDFESTTPEGKKLKLSEVLPKARYTLVDFWASWCGPCRAENPNVVKAYEQYGSKGLTILSVSLDTKAEPWKEAIKKDGMPWLHVSALKGFDEPAAVLYGIKMIPQNVLIDSKGKIVATNLRGYALEDKLKQLMN